MEEINSNFLGYFQTDNPYYMIGLKSRAYPYITGTKVSEDGIPIHIYGELYSIQRSDLRTFDALEGCPTNYVRRYEAIHLEKRINTEKTTKTYAYLYVLENTELLEGIKHNFTKRFMNIHSGDWVKYIEEGVS